MGLHLEFHVQSVSHRNMFMISKSYSTFDHVGDQRPTAIFTCSIIQSSFMLHSFSTSGKKCEEREEALQDFRTGQVCVLVATDVAARGCLGMLSLCQAWSRRPKGPLL